MKRLQLLSIIMFSIIGLISLQIPFTRLLGSSIKFTLFDFIAPTAGAFLGTTLGIVSVFITQIINIALLGGKIPDIGGIIRLFPTLFAVIYFSKKRAINIVIPALAILIFNLHPIGRSAWQYSLFWLIPIACHFLREKSPKQVSLFIRSLGATFTAHAVGGAAWVWAFGLSKQIWLALIPQVIIERALMAAGISISYVVLTNLLKLAEKKKIIPQFIRLDKHFLIS